MAAQGHAAMHTSGTSSTSGPSLLHVPCKQQSTLGGLPIKTGCDRLLGCGRIGCKGPVTQRPTEKEQDLSLEVYTDTRISFRGNAAAHAGPCPIDFADKCAKECPCYTFPSSCLFTWQSVVHAWVQQLPAALGGCCTAAQQKTAQRCEHNTTGITNNHVSDSHSMPYISACSCI